MTRYKWIPKTLLQAQSYYEGQTCLWIPKPQLTSNPTQNVPSKPLSSPRATILLQPLHLKNAWQPRKLATTLPSIKEQAQLLHQVLVYTITQEATI